MPNRVKSWAARKGKEAVSDRAAAARKGEIVKTIQREAKKNGATLKNDGKGGLDPQIALDAFRAAEWRCENEKCPTPKEDLDLDHYTGHPKEIFEDPDSDVRLRRDAAEMEGEKDDDYIHVLCAKCHDVVEQRERAIENGNKPPPMRGASAA
jgi:hypothetical protein